MQHKLHDGRMTDREVLSVALRIPAKRIPNLEISYLATCSDAELANWFTPDQIGRFRASVEIARRTMYDLSRPQFRSPQDSANFLMAHYGAVQQEIFVVLCLDAKNRIQNVHELYRGTAQSAVIRVGEVFKEAIRLNSTAIICSHNHPSGDPSPSGDDIHTTKDIAQAGKLLDIDVLDHIVIGSGSWVSMRERGLF
jgi:DNA repair protein RadC